MQIKIKCPNKDCGKTLVVDSEMAGKKGKCSTCDTVFLIPSAPGSKSGPGGSTIDLAAPKSGDQSAERKKASKTGTKSRKPSKRRGGSRSGESKRSGEKYLDDYDDYIEKPKPPRGGVEDYSLSEDDYVDYEDYDDPGPNRGGGRAPRRPERAPGGRDDFYDDYEDDYDDYAPPRGRRGRDDYYDDPYDDPYADDYYEDPYADPYGAPVAAGGRGRRRKSGPNIGLIRAGMMVMAVAGFVFCGSIAINMLVELIAQLGSGIGDTGRTFKKIAALLWMGAATAVIVGYSFLLVFPNKSNSRGLTIAALSVGSINLIVQIVFKIVPMFSDRFNPFGLYIQADTMIEGLLKVGLIEGMFIAEIILIALAMMAINKQLKDRYNLLSAKQMIIPAGIYGGILIVIGMFLLIIDESNVTSPTARKIWEWVIYLLRVGSQGMLIWYFISYILLMFNTRNAIPKS